MDLRAVNLSSGCLWASKRNPSHPTHYRLLQVRAASGRRGNNKNKNNRDHDPPSPGGNDPPSPGSGNSEDRIFGKSKRETSKITSMDWRTFRANLVAREQIVEDFDIGQDQMPLHTPSRRLGSKWAHPLSVPETGCVLIATEKLDGIHEFERSVILLLRSGTGDPREGPFGVILNQPLHKKMKHLKMIDANLANIFSRCSIHFGGPLDDSMFLLRTDGLLHIHSFEQVIPGICFGTRNSIDQAAELIKEGVLRPQDFRFFLGYAGWQLDQLREEIEFGYWVVAACSSDMIRRTSPISSYGLWEDILQLMGGPYAELSRKPRQEGL